MGTMWVCNTCFADKQRQNEAVDKTVVEVKPLPDPFAFLSRHTRKHTPTFMNTARSWDKTCNKDGRKWGFYLDLVFTCFNTLMAVEAWEGIDNVLEAETMFLYDSSTELILAILTALHMPAKSPDCNLKKYAQYREAAFRVLLERDPENFKGLTYGL